MSATKKSINAKIADLKIEVQGRAGDGCYYFTSIETGLALNSESVYVGSLRHLNLRQWREVAESAIEEDSGEAFKKIEDAPPVFVLKPRVF
jgi:hypothetical protein